jgi:hypothetical protein
VRPTRDRFQEVDRGPDFAAGRWPLVSGHRGAGKPARSIRPEPYAAARFASTAARRALRRPQKPATGRLLDRNPAGGCTKFGDRKHLIGQNRHSMARAGCFAGATGQCRLMGGPQSAFSGSEATCPTKPAQSAPAKHRDFDGDRQLAVVCLAISWRPDPHGIEPGRRTGKPYSSRVTNTGRH